MSYGQCSWFLGSPRPRMSICPRLREPLFVAAAANLFEGVRALRRQPAHQSRARRVRDGATAAAPRDTRGQVEFRHDAAGQHSFPAGAPFDDLVAPMSGRLIEAGKFELQKVLDDVLAKRLAGVQLASAQIFDLLGDVLDVEPVCRRPASGAAIPPVPASRRRNLRRRAISAAMRSNLPQPWHGRESPHRTNPELWYTRPAQQEEDLAHMALVASISQQIWDMKYRLKGRPDRRRAARQDDRGYLAAGGDARSPRPSATPRYGPSASTRR